MLANLWMGRPAGEGICETVTSICCYSELTIFHSFIGSLQEQSLLRVCRHCFCSRHGEELSQCSIKAMKWRNTSTHRSIKGRNVLLEEITTPHIDLTDCFILVKTAVQSNMEGDLAHGSLTGRTGMVECINVEAFLGDFRKGCTGVHEQIPELLWRRGSAWEATREAHDCKRNIMMVCLKG